ncbi:hypothetical protein [Hymenobacter nivis]|uniref:Uncharacterized protein n=1 Tax=Hymenobacter nivis TaxID=1850093 RepID=A0A2Z3GIS3_9BACT|nr:hypothetical protein [Hymenobacter nivis]AWM32121.1 hypothetical protein DDQ68_04515 [Hymenobacter nivis]
MSWKGAARSFAATARRIERDQQRRSRIAAQQFKQLQKEQVVTSAAQAVATYNDYLAVIGSVHHDCSPELNWAAVQQEKAPGVPTPSVEHERNAQAALAGYQPGFLDRLFKRGPKKQEQLAQAVATARQCDQQVTLEQQANHTRQYADWQERQELAAQVLAKNAEVYSSVLDAFAPFAGIEHLGSHLEFTFTADHVEVDVHVRTAEVIPDFVVSQLASGKLSRKKLSLSKFNELYQDLVCGALLRVAREVFAHLPVAQVVTHALVEQLNPATGQIERHVIASASMPRATLETLNFTALDPSDSMRNFTHTMKFTKTGGFQAVERVGLAAPVPSPRSRGSAEPLR